MILIFLKTRLKTLFPDIKNRLKSLSYHIVIRFTKTYKHSVYHQQINTHEITHSFHQLTNPNSLFSIFIGSNPLVTDLIRFYKIQLGSIPSNQKLYHDRSSMFVISIMDDLHHLCNKNSN